MKTRLTTGEHMAAIDSAMNNACSSVSEIQEVTDLLDNLRDTQQVAMVDPISGATVIVSFNNEDENLTNQDYARVLREFADFLDKPDRIKKNLIIEE